MNTKQTLTMKAMPEPLTWLKGAMRVILAAIGWALLIFTTLFTGYLTGWILYTTGRLGSAQVGEILPLLLVLFAITAGLAWLVSRFIAPVRMVGLVILATLALLLIGGGIWTQAYPDRALYWARQLAWGDSAMTDYERFPERMVNNAAPAFHFMQDPSPELFQTVEYRSGGELKQMGFEEFLQSTQTTSFIVIKDDAILYESYFNGYNRDSIVTSFSVAKSFTSALIGIAIDEGYIGSVNDLMIAYLPELKGKGLDDVTIRDLLLMSAGISYVVDEEVSLLAQITQFTDSGLTYSYPNLRDLALRVKPDGQAPGAEFNYNNYHPLLLGMILERTTGRPAAEYLQEKLWKPLGMEYPASWSLDSKESGFELMQSGINGRAIDFAKFGRLFLNNGNWDGIQIISEKWVTESTAPDPHDHRLWRSDVDWKRANGYYKYMWWGRLNPDGSYDYAAQGHLGQRICISPQEQVIIVRFGLDEGGVDSWADVFQSLAAKVK